MMELRALPPHRCIALLTRQELGRIGYTEDALPSIAPVTYALRDGVIVVRTSVPADVLAGQVIAFSADDLDVDAHTGWSVVVVGKAERISFPDEVRPVPWNDGPPEHFLRIPMSLVHGRVRKMSVVPFADVY